MCNHISWSKYRFWILSELVGQSSLIRFAGGEEREERRDDETRGGKEKANVKSEGRGGGGHREEGS